MDEAVTIDTPVGRTPPAPLSSARDFSARHLAACLALGLGLSLNLAGAAHAASTVPAPALPDPTRPPAAAAPVPDGAAKVDAEPQLQSVLLHAPAGGRVAVIDGQAVRVGGRFRDARVTRIADNEVELTRGRERQVLRLFAPAPAEGISRSKGTQ